MTSPHSQRNPNPAAHNQCMQPEPHCTTIGVAREGTSYSTTRALRSRCGGPACILLLMSVPGAGERYSRQTCVSRFRWRTGDDTSGSLASRDSAPTNSHNRSRPRIRTITREHASTRDTKKGHSIVTHIHPTGYKFPWGWLQHDVRPGCRVAAVE